MTQTHSSTDPAQSSYERLRLLDAVFQATDEAMMVTDKANAIVAVNPAFERTTGYEASEVLGQNPKILSSGRHNRDFYAELWATLRKTGHWHGEIWNRRKSGEIYVQRVTISLICDAEGQIVNYVAVFSDVTHAKHEADRIRYYANYDALTGLPNRVLLEDRFRHALVKAAREKANVGVMFLDLNRFKAVNDRFGHRAGDRLLQAVAARLRRCVRESDTVARLGGDEFVVLLSEICEKDAQQVAAKIRAALSEPFLFDDISINTACAIGIAYYPANGESVEALLESADRAMYVDKRRVHAAHTP